jgi:uncharacterized membrane protein
MALQLGRERTREFEPMSEMTYAHLYRAEISRSTSWRTRLDTTTNWAITTAAAVMSLSFSNARTPHATVLVGFALVCVFLGIETRRYRYYDLWARRVRLIETGYLVPLLRREEPTDDFAAALASELSKPRLRISAVDSLTFRFSRTYAPIVALMLAGWVVKLDIHPAPARSFHEMVARGSIGPLPAAVVWAGWLLTCLGALVLLLRARRAPLPPTELRAPARGRRHELGPAFRRLVEFRPGARPR